MELHEEMNISLKFISEVNNNQSNRIKNDNDEKIIDLKQTYPSYDINLFPNLGKIEVMMCKICHKIPNPETALEVKCSGDLYCERCMINFLGQSRVCPSCKEKMIFFYDVGKKLVYIRKDSLIIYKILNRVKIKCPDNCEWIGRVNEVSEHRKICPKARLACKYRILGCNFTGSNEEIKGHIEGNQKEHLEMACNLVKNNKKIGGRVKTHEHLLYLTECSNITWTCDLGNMDKQCPNPEVRFKVPSFCCEPCGYYLCNSCFMNNFEGFY